MTGNTMVTAFDVTPSVLAGTTPPPPPPVGFPPPPSLVVFSLPPPPLAAITPPIAPATIATTTTTTTTCNHAPRSPRRRHWRRSRTPAPGMSSPRTVDAGSELPGARQRLVAGTKVGG